ncbi:MAG: hypothetical protein UV28_C0027G0003 [Candidatus Collierbacteria bacterium GW2011_GWE2_42_48]|nr:MAG: hypothetical protein UV28_C0027G0003 [Candidatus Collierbacteria bacterium GW2011_GWE2_42_48]
MSIDTDTHRKTLIKKSITRTLRTKLDTPEKVVYLFIEIGKYKELCGDKHEGMLFFYRDWVAHSELAWNSTMIKWLKRLESHIKTDSTGKQIARSFITNESQFFMLDTLKEEFKIFVTINTLPDKLLTNNIRWKVFIKTLMGVIEESSIKRKKGRLIKELSCVKGQNDKPSFKFKLSLNVRSPMVKLNL